MADENVIRYRLLAGFPIGVRKSNTPMGYLLNIASKALERLSTVPRIDAKQSLITPLNASEDESREGCES